MNYKPSTQNGIKECFVAFIDVLGFKDMIEKDNATGQYLEIVKKAITKGTSLLKKRQEEKDNLYKFWYDEFKVKSFSDCFCFSIPLEFDNGEKDYRQNLVAFYIWLMVFYNELLLSGFLCRGGITQGWHYSGEDIIFSKALIDAYGLESKSAIHPLILIDSKLVDKIRGKGMNEEIYYKYMFAHDTAGRSFLHPFNYGVVEEIFFGGKNDITLDKEIADRNQLINTYVSILNEKIKEHTGKIQVDKYQWLKEFCHYTIDKQHMDKFRDGLLDPHTI